jgi:pyruvate carboxylase
MSWGLKTVAIYAEQDKLALHRFKADEAYQVGIWRAWPDRGLSVHRRDYSCRQGNSGADAIHPGYGLLSESPEFVDACE